MPMQLIQRTTLLFQDDKSDKVYEVDLVQTATDGAGNHLYVVNFRYGKRGKNLREGSETSSAVPEAEARRAFDKLVASKTKKGYVDVTDRDLAQLKPGTHDATPPAKPKREIDPAARARVILERLQAEIRGETPAVKKDRKTKQDKKPWPIDRVIWRAGELGITEAAPLLMQLLTSEPMRRYCVIWAVGNCGDANVVAQLEDIYQNDREAEHVRRIALEAIFKLSPSHHKTSIQAEILSSLRLPFKDALDREDSEALTSAIQQIFDTNNAEDFEILDRLYQIENPTTRTVLLEVLRTAPFEPNYFQSIRHIFKAAEYRHDGEVFGLLARRFETEAAMYQASEYHIRFKNGEYIHPVHYNNYNYETQSYPENPQFAEYKNPDNGKLAYSQDTKNYFQRRIWRHLKTLGDLGREEYLELASAVLLRYSDRDGETLRNTTRYRWDRDTWERREIGTTHWDKFAAHLTFNHILYQNSPRYQLKRNRSAWSCKGKYKPGDGVPSVREEAFPDLWTQQPQALLKLLLASECEAVHEFAVKAIRNCMDFGRELSVDNLLQLLAQPYTVTAQFAFELAIDRYNPQSPNLDLVSAIANCAYTPARSQSYQWIEAQPQVFLTQPHLVASLITSPEIETQTFIQSQLQAAQLTTAQQQEIVTRVIALIITLESGQNAFAQRICDSLYLLFSTVLPQLNLGVILDLLQHQLPELQVFGGRILLDRDRIDDLPNSLIENLLDSPFESVRAIGVGLFGRLPDDRLLAQIPLLQAFLTHESESMREAIRPSIRRLATNNAAFRQELVNTLLTILQHPEANPEVQAFLTQVLATDIPDWMQEVSQEHALMLINTQSSAAQEMGGHILGANYQVWAEDFNTSEIVQFAHHQVKLIRDTAKSIVQIRLPKLRQNASELMGLVNILDADWEDGRATGMALFGEWLTPSELNPAILINICDSNRADVRKFGRDLVTRCFQDRDGEEYLLKFSEHPATDMQLFTTQYLESYASDNPDRLQELMPYFVRVAGQINRAKIAKQRVFAFLDRESTKSEAAAKIVAEILARQSATIAIGERAKSIEIMLKIHHKYPDLPLAISVKSVSCK
jgi:predicted DNA-binding WGR domain protein